jgi:hypothetical protein
MWRLIVVALVLGSVPGVGRAQQQFIYPDRGQTRDQQARDRWECHSWAVQQTGFDPSAPQMAQAAPLPPPPSMGPPQGGNLPHLIRVDTKQKMLHGLGVDQRTAPIHNLERRDGRIVMYGGQEGRGWTLIVEASGRMSATVVDDRVSVIMFGACAAP